MNARAKEHEEPKRLLTAAELAREFGMTETAVRSRVYDGHWVESVHFYRRGRRIMYDPDAVRRWWLGRK